MKGQDDPDGINEPPEDERQIVRVCRNANRNKKPKDTTTTRYRWCSCFSLCKLKLTGHYKNIDR